eukprot:8466521-Lingulodinium_polyedra.AAC.1
MLRNATLYCAALYGNATLRRSVQRCANKCCAAQRDATQCDVVQRTAMLLRRAAQCKTTPECNAALRCAALRCAALRNA